MADELPLAAYVDQKFRKESRNEKRELGPMKQIFELNKFDFTIVEVYSHLQVLKQLLKKPGFNYGR